MLTEAEAKRKQGSLNQSFEVRTIFTEQYNILILIG